MKTVHFHGKAAIDTEQSLRQLCEKLGIPFERGMLSSWEAKPAEVDVEREPWKLRALEPPDAAAVDRRKASLSPAEVLEIESVVWLEMTRYGYAASSPLRLRLPKALLRMIQQKLHRLQQILGKTPGTGHRPEDDLQKKT